MEYKNGEKKKQDDYIAEIVKAFSEVQTQYPQFSTLLEINDGKTLSLSGNSNGILRATHLIISSIRIWINSYVESWTFI